MTSQEEIDQAEAEGKAAAQAVPPVAFSANPHSMAQGSPARVLGIAWRRGYKAGEIEADDAAGDLFRGTVRS